MLDVMDPALPIMIDGMLLLARLDALLVNQQGLAPALTRCRLLRVLSDNFAGRSLTSRKNPVKRSAILDNTALSCCS